MIYDAHGYLGHNDQFEGQVAQLFAPVKSDNQIGANAGRFTCRQRKPDPSLGPI